MTKKIKSPEKPEKFRKEILAQRDPRKPCVAICAGTGCLALVSDKIIDIFKEELAKNGLQDKAELRETGCPGFCEKGPIVVIYPECTRINAQTFRINQIHRITHTIPIQIRIPASKENRVFRRPASRIRVIISVAEPHELRVSVVQSSGKAEWNRKSRICIVYDIAEGIVFNLPGSVISESVVYTYGRGFRQDSSEAKLFKSSCKICITESSGYTLP